MKKILLCTAAASLFAGHAAADTLTLTTPITGDLSDYTFDQLTIGYETELGGLGYDITLGATGLSGESVAASFGDVAPYGISTLGSTSGNWDTKGDVLSESTSFGVEVTYPSFTTGGITSNLVTDFDMSDSVSSGTLISYISNPTRPDFGDDAAPCTFEAENQNSSLDLDLASSYSFAVAGVPITIDYTLPIFNLNAAESSVTMESFVNAGSGAANDTAATCLGADNDTTTSTVGTETVSTSSTTFSMFSTDPSAEITIAVTDRLSLTGELGGNINNTTGNLVAEYAISDSLTLKGALFGGDPESVELKYDAGGVELTLALDSLSFSDDGTDSTSGSAISLSAAVTF